VKKTEFTLGDWVWYWYPRRYQKKSPKWQKSYTGPYLIVRVIEPVNYVLQKTSRSKPFVVHADKVKKCHGITPDVWLAVPSIAISESTQSQAGERPPEAEIVSPLLQENNLIHNDIPDIQPTILRTASEESNVQHKAGKRPPNAGTAMRSRRRSGRTRDPFVATLAPITEDATEIGDVDSGNVSPDVNTMPRTRRNDEKNRDSRKPSTRFAVPAAATDDVVQPVVEEHLFDDVTVPPKHRERSRWHDDSRTGVIPLPVTDANEVNDADDVAMMRPRRQNRRPPSKLADFVYQAISLAQRNEDRRTRIFVEDRRLRGIQERRRQRISSSNDDGDNVETCW